MKRLNAAGSCTEICIDVLWLSGGWIYCTMLLPACGDEGYEVALGAALDLFCLLVRETRHLQPGFRSISVWPGLSPMLERAELYGDTGGRTGLEGGVARSA